VHTLLLARSASLHSPTLDEPAHLVAGISHWEFGDMSLYRVNPPLIRSIAVIPLFAYGFEMTFDPKTDFGLRRWEFNLGNDFVAQNGRRIFWQTTLARWACIPFCWLGASICFCWARDLYGSTSGLVACTLWCFSPMVLGHGALMTPDAHASALGLTACYSFWLWLRSPSWRLTIFTGLLLGVAELSKTTLILLVPLWPVLWILYRLNDGRPHTWALWRSEAMMLIARLAIGLFVINLGYLGNGTFTPLREYPFVSDTIGGPTESSENAGDNSQEWKERNQFRNTILGDIPIPLPFDYVLGIDYQQRDFEHSPRPSYLGGVYSSKGWWYYYLYVVAIKSPLGTLGLLGMVCALRMVFIMPTRRWVDEIVLVSPALLIFFVVSSKTGFSHHGRYIFPCIPMVFIWASQAGTHIRDLRNAIMGECTARMDGRSEQSFIRCVTQNLMGSVSCVLLVWSIVSSLFAFPHSQSYFNELVGGPRNGPDHLLFSNVDWGQDLLQLEKWVIEHNSNEPVFLAFFDCFNPFGLGIKNIAPWPMKQASTGEPGFIAAKDTLVPSGLFAIDVNHLYEFPYMLWNEDGTNYFIDTRPLKFLRAMKPIDTVGYSIRIFTSEQLKSAYASAASVQLDQ
jgi:hypothetical protein